MSEKRKLQNKYKRPVVSVIIPTFNRSKLLQKAIESVLQQTLKNFELIIVDDGSKDNTKELVLQYGKKDPRIRYFYHKNRGLSASRNRGLKESKGKYIALLDDDDIWLKDKLKKQIEVFKTSDLNKLGVVYSYTYIINEHGRIVNLRKRNFRGDLFTDLLGGQKILGGGSAILIKKEVFQKVGQFDENLRSCEDWDMWSRISVYFQFDLVHEPLIKKRVHPQAMSNIRKKMLICRLVVIAKMFTLMMQHKKSSWQGMKNIIWATYFTFKQLFDFQ